MSEVIKDLVPPLNVFASDDDTQWSIQFQVRSQACMFTMFILIFIVPIGSACILVKELSAFTDSWVVLATTIQDLHFGGYQDLGRFLLHAAIEEKVRDPAKYLATGK